MSSPSALSTTMASVTVPAKATAPFTNAAATVEPFNTDDPYHDTQ
jgi:hypothetical protein